MSPLSSRPKLLTVFSLLLTTIYFVTFVAFLFWQANVEEVTSSELQGRKKPANEEPGMTTGHRTRGRNANKRIVNITKLLSSAVPDCENTRFSLGNKTAINHTHQQDSVNHDAFTHNVESPSLPECEELPDATVNKFQTVAGRHFVYSAYYDDRTTANGGSLLQPVVRITALLRSSNGPTGVRPSPILYCHVWLYGAHYSSPLDYYEMCENHGKQYGGWLLTCRLPTASNNIIFERPCRIGISNDATDSKQIVNLTLFRTTGLNDINNGQMAMCIPPLFGHVSTKTLVEFIELTHLIGFSHMVFYWTNRENDTAIGLDNVLQHYRNIGRISIIEWTLPNVLVTSSNAAYAGLVWYHGQLLAINDCLYRTMHAFNRVAFNDIDEYIIPRRQHAHLKGALASIDRRFHNSTPFCAYSFRSAFFDPMTSLIPSSRGNLTPDIVGYELESDLRTVALSNVRTKVSIILTAMFKLHAIQHFSRNSCSIV
jgi:hypothetical protein